MGTRRWKINIKRLKKERTFLKGKWSERDEKEIQKESKTGERKEERRDDGRRRQKEKRGKEGERRLQHYFTHYRNLPWIKVVVILISC